MSTLAPYSVFCRPQDFHRNLISHAEEEAALSVIRKARRDHKAFDRYGGEEVDTYEREFAAHVGTKFATAVSSGTAAIHAALAALNLQPGDEVVCPPITDPGGISPVLFQLGIPVFADTHPGTFNISPQGLRQAITSRTKVIMVAHIAGEPCEMEEIMSIAREHELPLIEDVAQAHDAVWADRKCGNWGTVGTFSLMSGKHQTSGGQGGMVATNDETLYWRAKSFADRGKNFGREDIGGFAGLNYRMTELEAAIGRVQLRRLPGFIARRQVLAAHFSNRLQDSAVFRVGEIPALARSTYWFLRVHVDLKGSHISKNAVAEALRKRGVPAAPTYTSIIYRQPWFANKAIFGRSGLPWSLPHCQQVPSYENCCPQAEMALATHLMVALNESISDDTIRCVADAFLDVEKELFGR